jgi:FMN phosphatase YigB (HAD superfamily)
VKRAVLIDALGTMLWLQPPWEHADPEAFAGIEPERVQAGFVAEMTYYMAHTADGGGPDSLADLRRRCAAVLTAEVGREISVATMMDAIRFELFPDTLPALRGLRDAGLRVVCLSNWDCSLPGTLAGLGIDGLLDGVVTSASSGSRKPEPEIFEAALELAGCGPGEALHVGDSDDDVIGARGAGIEVLRIARAGGGDIASLAEIEEHLRR